ncbi:uncharacterized protein LOC117643253 [Thrips palmi]|uniref:Uncharacterized protein LOC117643253 n=1 Tax=Thrips palmi TaxID=161013 RepID=A0A6P8YDX1_THRPL|nr:uncharacterized protein LOC117643253 [Thrips palmi]
MCQNMFVSCWYETLLMFCLPEFLTSRIVCFVAFCCCSPSYSNSNSAMAVACEFCGKQYRTVEWLKNHVDKFHPKQDVHNDPIADLSEPGSSDPSVAHILEEDASDVDEEAELLAEEAAARCLDWGDWSGTDDDEEIESYCQLVVDPSHEDEEEERRRAASAGASPSKSKSSQKGQSGVPLLKCRDCECHSQGFSTVDGYIKHRVGHGMQAAILRLSELQDILKQCPDLAREVFIKMQATKQTKGFAGSTTLIAAQLEKQCDSATMEMCFKSICDRLLDFLKIKSDFLFPSAFAGAFLTNLSVVVVDRPLRASIQCSLSILAEMSNDVSNVFVTMFIRNFAEKLLAYMLRVLSKGIGSSFVPLEQQYAVTNQSTCSTEFKQNMHFIGGSNVKSILRSALRIKHRNEEWQRLIATIKEQFVVSDFACAPDSELMAWTESVDRGRLTKISKKALVFFVHLGIEVKPLERRDGSLLNEEVIEKIMSSPGSPSLLLRWDELKGSLTERESYKLMLSLTHQFCISWRNGIIGRREDERAASKGGQKFGTGGVSFRANLGRK